VGYYHWERHQCHRQLFLDLWDLDFSNGIVGAAIGTIVSRVVMLVLCIILIKQNFIPILKILV
jgi:Na+-driven multidrug efflux pump